MSENGKRRSYDRAFKVEAVRLVIILPLVDFRIIR